MAVCGSGLRVRLRDKIAGVHAALIDDHFSARQGVEDDHMNIICMGGRTVGPAVAWDLVQTFLAAEFSQAERHLLPGKKWPFWKPGISSRQEPQR